MAVEIKDKYKNFNFCCVKTAVLIDELIIRVVFDAFGFSLEKINKKALLPDFYLIPDENPDLKLRCSMIELIWASTQLIRGKIELDDDHQKKNLGEGKIEPTNK